MPQGRINIVPPMKGYDEAKAFASQVEGTSPLVHNVMLLDPSTARFRPAQRAGDGKFDWYDFSTGETISATIVVIPADGQTASDGDGVNVIVKGDCPVINYTDSSLDLLMYETCSSVTIQIGGQPNTGSGYEGAITITNGSESINIPYSRPGDSTAGVIEDAGRPYMKLMLCASASTNTGMWVHQDVLAEYSAAPVLLDNNSASDYYGYCLQVTGQRATETQAEEGTIRALTDFTYFRTCAGCNDTSNQCCYEYHVAYDCNSSTWGAVTLATATCLAASEFPPTDVWKLDIDQFGQYRTFTRYGRGLSCGSTPDCTDETVPDAPTGLPTAIDPAATCGDNLDACSTSCSSSIAFVFGTAQSGFTYTATGSGSTGYISVTGGGPGGAGWASGFANYSCDNPEACTSEAYLPITRNSTTGTWSVAINYPDIVFSTTGASSSCPPGGNSSTWTTTSVSPTQGNILRMHLVIPSVDTPILPTITDVLSVSGMSRISLIADGSGVTNTPTYRLWDGTLHYDAGSNTWMPVDHDTPISIAIGGGNYINADYAGTIYFYIDSFYCTNLYQLLFPSGRFVSGFFLNVYARYGGSFNGDYAPRIVSHSSDFTIPDALEVGYA